MEFEAPPHAGVNSWIQPATHGSCSDSTRARYRVTVGSHSDTSGSGRIRPAYPCASQVSLQLYPLSYNWCQARPTPRRYGAALDGPRQCTYKTQFSVGRLVFQPPDVGLCVAPTGAPRVATPAAQPSPDAVRLASRSQCADAVCSCSGVEISDSAIAEVLVAPTEANRISGDDEVQRHPKAAP